METNRMTTDLSAYGTGEYHPGAGLLKRVFWYFTNALFFLNPLCTSYRVKRCLLRLFGAKLGRAVVIKPGVNIKYPWHLEVGDYTWIGERAWIDNLTRVSVGSHACLSQGTILLCGNHDYGKRGFDLMVKPVTLGDGAWIGAASIVGPGTEMGSHAVVTAGSVASGKLEPYGIYRGNPAVKIREREIAG
jgi:putative colanic acid biosynthesis acetyltransferase WcaF